MKINNGQNPEISRLFAARANPWAPKYEPHLWNDASESAYDLTQAKYESVLQGIGGKLGYHIDRANKVARLLSRFNDNSLGMLAEKPEAEMTEMRRRFMKYLNTTAFSTNCYAYALNLRLGSRPGELLTPGHLKDFGKDGSHPMEGRTVTDLFDGLAKDGFEFFKGHPNRDRPPEYFYLAAVMVRLNAGKGHDTMKDFHFIRYDRDGACSHKLGHGYVMNLDHKGNQFIDPTKSGACDGYQYQGCILVPTVLPQQQLAL